jgi:hypothetical protein
VVGAGAGALAFGLFGSRTGFILFAVATLLAIVQLARILVRAPGKSGDGTGGRRRW